jgi:hypothetical protein
LLKLKQNTHQLDEAVKIEKGNTKQKLNQIGHRCGSDGGARTVVFWLHGRLIDPLNMHATNAGIAYSLRGQAEILVDHRSAQKAYAKPFLGTRRPHCKSPVLFDILVEELQLFLADSHNPQTFSVPRKSSRKGNLFS